MGNAYCGNNFAARKQKIFWPESSKSKSFLLPGHKCCFRNMFPSLATMETMLTRFQCCSLKLFSNNGKQTAITDGEVEVEEQGKRESNWKNEERELLIVLFDSIKTT